MNDDNPEVPALITLPVTREAFKDFMASLLGKPESVEGGVEGAFEIDFGGFEQLNYRIDDRITKQNKSEFIQFTAKLFFDDNSSFSFSSIKSFLQYKEQRNLICTGFIFTWIYLVEFYDKKVPEKQEISISSIISGISYSIRCTNKGWGIEIAELIRNCTTSFIKTNVPFAGFRRKFIKYLSQQLLQIFSFFLVFLLSFVFLWIYSQERLTSCKSLSDKIIQFVGDNILLAEKVDFLIKFFNTCQLTTLKENVIVLFFTLFSFVTSFILCTFIAALVRLLIQLPTYRFILFTEASKKEREKYFTRTSRISWWRNFWLITVGVSSILALLNRILWNYVSEWWINIFS